MIGLKLSEMKSGSGFFGYAYGVRFLLPDGRKRTVMEGMAMPYKHRLVFVQEAKRLHRNLCRYRFDAKKASGGGVGEQPQPETSRKKRGGKKHRKNTQQHEVGMVSTWCKQANSSPVLVPTAVKSLDYSAKPIAYECLQALVHIVGSASKQVLRPIRIDSVGMLLALETGNDPTPYIDRRTKGRTVNVAITADISGSCQHNSPYTQSVAMLIADTMGEAVQVYYAPNFNGRLLSECVNGYCNVLPYPDNTDVVIYFGDEDGLEIAEIEAEKGTIFIVLSCHNARQADGLAHLRRHRSAPKGGAILYYGRIDIKSGVGIAAAIKDAAKKI